MSRQIECIICKKEFIGEEFIDGQCPFCGREYSWDVQYYFDSIDDDDNEGDIDDELVLVDWKVK